MNIDEIESNYRNQASRQYQHNDCSGLVFGYDTEVIDTKITALIAMVRQLQDEAAQSHEDYKIQLNEIIRCHDLIKQLQADKAGLVEALKEFAEYDVNERPEPDDTYLLRRKIGYFSALATEALKQHGQEGR